MDMSIKPWDMLDMGPDYTPTPTCMCAGVCGYACNGWILLVFAAVRSLCFDPLAALQEAEIGCRLLVESFPEACRNLFVLLIESGFDSAPLYSDKTQRETFKEDDFIIFSEAQYTHPEGL